jgi:hypothetical protein
MGILETTSSSTINLTPAGIQISQEIDLRPIHGLSCTFTKRISKRNTIFNEANEMVLGSRNLDLASTSHTTVQPTANVPRYNDRFQ